MTASATPCALTSMAAIVLLSGWQASRGANLEVWIAADLDMPMFTIDVVGGRRLTADFLGGIFSLDGIHPTNTGYAVVANEFIRGLNEGFDAGIRPFSAGEIAHILHTDPLILPGVGRPPQAEPFTALEVLRGLDVIRNGF